MDSALQARWLFPVRRNVKAPDGSGSAPWTLATSEQVSHGMVMKSIGRFVSCGKAAVCGNSKIIGSNAENPIRQSVAMAIRMEGSPPNLVVWRELATGIEFHCNDFSVLPMPWGTSGYARFGVPCPPLTNAAVDRDEDYHEPITQLIQLDGLGLASSDQAIHERETLRELGELPRPNAGALDSIGRFVECTGDGDWVLTGKRIVEIAVGQSCGENATRLIRERLSDFIIITTASHFAALEKFHQVPRVHSKSSIKFHSTFIFILGVLFHRFITIL